MVYLTTCTCSRCGKTGVIVQQCYSVAGVAYVGEMGQPLHARVNGDQFDITHRRTEVSLVAKHFNGWAHSESDMTVIVIELSTCRDPRL